MSNKMQGKPNIVEVVSQYVPLRKAGKDYQGLCLFHEEKTPSFMVSESKQVFFCHSCKEGGDVIKFIMKLKGLSFKEALADLGIKTDPQPYRTKAERRKQMIEDLARVEAKLLCRRTLRDHSNLLAEMIRIINKYVFGLTGGRYFWDATEDEEIFKEVAPKILSYAGTHEQAREVGIMLTLCRGWWQEIEAIHNGDQEHKWRSFWEVIGNERVR